MIIQIIKNMKKLLICLLMILPFLSMAQVVKFTVTNPTPCAGYGPENLTVAVLKDIPAYDTIQYAAAFEWHLVHEGGASWKWTTSLSQRALPVPFPGNYSIIVGFYLVQRSNRIVWKYTPSDPVKITAKMCEVKNPEPTTKKN